jgi:nucleotide-binding universal stress UspA family protein
MDKFKTIIVGVDFSSYSKRVVKQAKYLSRTWKAKIILVHSVHEIFDYANPHLMFAMFPSMPSIGTYVSRIRRFYNFEHQKDIVVGYDSPAQMILKTAKKYPEPLILVGYRGHSPIVEFFIGSTAQELIRKSKFPVWIQRGNEITHLDKDTALDEMLYNNPTALRSRKKTNELMKRARLPIIFTH